MWIAALLVMGSVAYVIGGAAAAAAAAALLGGAFVLAARAARQPGASVTWPDRGRSDLPAGWASAGWSAGNRFSGGGASGRW